MAWYRCLHPQAKAVSPLIIPARKQPSWGVFGPAERSDFSRTSKMTLKFEVRSPKSVWSGRETGYTPSSPHDRAVLRSSDLRYGQIPRYGTIGMDLPKSDEIARTGQRAHSARIPPPPEVAHGPSSQPPPAGRMRACVLPTAADSGFGNAGPAQPLRVPIRSACPLFWRLGEANTSPPHAPGPEQSSRIATSRPEAPPGLQDPQEGSNLKWLEPPPRS